MSEAYFPVNDLLRRRLQTSLAIVSLTLCVASTLFLLLFGERIGTGVFSLAQNKLTAGFSLVLDRFMLFIGLLVFVVGMVIVAFTVFVMMSQRIRDIGLMKAAGCPNDLVFGYFMTELVITAIVGCSLGVVLALLVDYGSASLLSSFGFPIPQKPFNYWLVLLVFGVFFVLALVLGTKPILETTRVEPAKAISPTYYFGTSKEPGVKVFSKSGLTFKIAMRSLFRRKSATIRIVLCLSIVFLLVTISIAGGIIADGTTKSWVEKAVGIDVVLIAQQNMASQYARLVSKFYETVPDLPFDYSNVQYQVPESIVSYLNSKPEVTGVDQRLVLKMHVEEIRNYTFNPETAETIPVGDDREGDSIVVGLVPSKALTRWFVEGRFLNGDQSREAMIGDSLASAMFSEPLSQGTRVAGADFDVVGLCFDPLNNGNVTYVPLATLQNVTGIAGPNVVLVKIDPSADRLQVLTQIRADVTAMSPSFVVVELNEVLEKTLGFLGYVWSSIILLPLFSLVAASLCLIGYVMLSIAEQRQEFGVLRALGAKPNTIVKVVSGQSFVVLLASYAVGVAFGIIGTLLILVPEPLVTNYTVLTIAGWLLAAFMVTFVVSLYPALRFSKKSLREMMT